MISTAQTKRTVNVDGHRGEQLLTGFSYQQEKPHAASQVDQQRHGIAWVTQEVNDGEEGTVELGLEPAVFDSVGLEDGVRVRVVVPRGATDKGRSKSPGNTDEGEAEDVIQRAGLGLGWRWICHRWIRFDVRLSC